MADIAAEIAEENLWRRVELEHQSSRTEGSMLATDSGTAPPDGVEVDRVDDGSAPAAAAAGVLGSTMDIERAGAG